MKPDFLDALADRVLVCDGAMGTMLYARGVFINKSFEQLNVSRPELVVDVHREYVSAGADVIETNTFGANRVKLGTFGLADSLRTINLEGVRLARVAAGDSAYVAGSIGPLGIRIEPWGKTGVDEAREYFREQAQALVDGGVDLIVLETFRDLNEIGAAIDAVRSISDLPIVAQMTTEEDGNTLDGTPPERFAPELERRGANLIGVNCAVGPAPMLETIERMEAVTRLRLSAQPNAGKPRDVEGRNLYLSSPEYIASYARRFVHQGVRLVGGCCGTTPEHVRQIKVAVRAVDGTREASVARASVVVTEAVDEPASHVVARADKSRLARALSEGNFVTLVSLQPPKGFQFSEAVEQARALKARAHAVTVPDGLHGARMSPLSAAVLLQQQAGVEAVLQYSCRDRNLLGMQSDLLGAHALGIRNVLLVTGDARSVGDYADATAVFDVDSIGLTNVVSRLNHARDVGGQPIGHPTAFLIGVMVNPGAESLESEIRRFAYKVEAGAEFAITKPVFEVASVERFVRAAERFGIPIVAGLWPFESALNAEFMANEVPGVQVPASVLDRMRRAKEGTAAAAEGIAIVSEVGRALRGLVQGLHVSAPSTHVGTALEVLDRVGADAPL